MLALRLGEDVDERGEVEYVGDFWKKPDSYLSMAALASFFASRAWWFMTISRSWRWMLPRKTAGAWVRVVRCGRGEERLRRWDLGDGDDVEVLRWRLWGWSVL
jgi:hypothetical protein